MLLTGASAGVGEELAYHYARLGSHLVLTAHTEALLQRVSLTAARGGRGTVPGLLHLCHNCVSNPCQLPNPVLGKRPWGLRLRAGERGFRLQTSRDQQVVVGGGQ